MCEWGTTRPTVVRKGRTSFRGFAIAPIDECIQPLVEALNGAGITTVASCCGHGKRPGNIALADGRELFILPSYEAAREADKLWPIGIDGERSPTPSAVNDSSTADNR